MHAENCGYSVTLQEVHQVARRMESFDFRVGRMFLKTLFETSAGLIKSNMLRGEKKKSVNGING